MSKILNKDILFQCNPDYPLFFNWEILNFSILQKAKALWIKIFPKLRENKTNFVNTLLSLFFIQVISVNGGISNFLFLVHSKYCFLKTDNRTSLVFQWIRLHAKGHGFDPWSRTFHMHAARCGQKTKKQMKKQMTNWT